MIAHLKKISLFVCLFVCLFFHILFLFSIFFFWRLKLDSHLLKKFVVFAWLKAFWKWWECFLFQLKYSFRFQYILNFVTTFWSCRENSLIGKIRLTPKFMASQPGLQTIAIHLLPILHISRKGKVTRQWNLVN